MYELEDLLRMASDGSHVARGEFDPTTEDNLGHQPWSDRRTWAENWVIFPGSTNVYSARYCIDGSHQMQVMYGNKIIGTGPKSRFSGSRLYNYGPNERITPEFWYSFLMSVSKGNWSWSNLDRRWGSPINYRPLLT